MSVIWASFISVIAPVLGTLAGLLVLAILSKIARKLGVSLTQEQIAAVAGAADLAIKSTEMWADAKIRESKIKPNSQEKLLHTVETIKGMLTKVNVYGIADTRITEIVNARFPTIAPDLDRFMAEYHKRKPLPTDVKVSSGNP